MIGHFARFSLGALSLLGGVDDSDGGGSSGSASGRSSISYEGLMSELGSVLETVKRRSHLSFVDTPIAMVIQGRTALGELTHEYRSVWPVYQLREDYWRKDDATRPKKLGWYTRTIYVTESGKLVVMSGRGYGEAGVKHSKDYVWADVTPRILASNPEELSLQELSDIVTGVKSILR